MIVWGGEQAISRSLVHLPEDCIYPCGISVFLNNLFSEIMPLTCTLNEVVYQNNQQPQITEILARRSTHRSLLLFPFTGGFRQYAEEESWRHLVLFYEFFHAETGRGCGARSV